MLVLGVGIGLSMQVLTIIVQNTVEYRDLGVATSGVTFFRTMGSSFGAAVFGTIYANHLAPNLAKAVAPTGADPTQVTTPSAVHDPPARSAGGRRRGVRRHPPDRLRVRDPGGRHRLRGGAVPQAGADARADPARGLRDRSRLRHPRPAHRAGAARGPGRADPPDPAAGGRGHAARSPREAGLDAVQVWTLRQVAIQQIHAHGPADPFAVAAAHRVPMALIRPAIDDCIEAGLLCGGRRPGRAQRAGTRAVPRVRARAVGLAGHRGGAGQRRAARRAGPRGPPHDRPAARCCPTTRSPSRSSSPRPARRPGRPLQVLGAVVTGAIGLQGWELAHRVVGDPLHHPGVDAATHQTTEQRNPAAQLGERLLADAPEQLERDRLVDDQQPGRRQLPGSPG